MNIEHLYHHTSAEELLDAAWTVRRANFDPLLRLATPGAKRYQVEGFRNRPHRFAAISLTGRACALGCEHCQARPLHSMKPALTARALRDVADELVAKGCSGVLLSGGADHQGRVRLDDHLDAIGYLKSRGLTVIVHTGLVDEVTARDLKSTGVDQVLVDVIGDEETIRRVYHLDKTPRDYAASLEALKGAGLAIAPHVVIGLNFGRIRGEPAALKMITDAEPEVIVLVVLNPLPGTPMAGLSAPSPQTVAQLAAAARITNPRRPISLGCARPTGPLKSRMEQLAIGAGINALAYPTEGSIAHARSRSLRVEWTETCCSLC